jgi:hypothetical protein
MVGPNNPEGPMPHYAHEKIFKEGKCKCRDDGVSKYRCDNCLKQMLKEDREKKEKEVSERTDIWEENAE